MDDGHEIAEVDAAAVLVVEDVLVWLETVVLVVADVLAELIEDEAFVLAALALVVEELVDTLPTSLAPQTPLLTAWPTTDFW